MESTNTNVNFALNQRRLNWLLAPGFLSCANGIPNSKQIKLKIDIWLALSLVLFLPATKIIIEIVNSINAFGLLLESPLSKVKHFSIGNKGHDWLHMEVRASSGAEVAMLSAHHHN